MAFLCPHSPCLYRCPSPRVLGHAARNERFLGMVTALCLQACLLDFGGRGYSLTLITWVKSADAFNSSNDLVLAFCIKSSCI